MRLLFVASIPMEFAGLERHIEDTRPADFAVDWARAARLGGQEVLLLANGAGRRRAAEAVDAAKPWRPDAIVSTGFCGGLDRELPVACIVIATAIASDQGAYTAAPGPQGASGGHCGLVCSIDHVARTAGEKRQLRETGACAVEMEAAGVAERAQSLTVPFFCVRAVTDLADETMANDFNSALRPDGHFDTMIILRGTLRRPMVRLPELFRLCQRSMRATRALGDFIAGCRF